MNNTDYIIVCSKCGGTNIETKAWVNPNSEKFTAFILEDNNPDDNWCNDCEEHVKFSTI